MEDNNRDKSREDSRGDNTLKNVNTLNSNNNYGQQDYMHEELKQPNPLKGIVVAILLGIVGAILWAIVVKVTGYNIGIAAIAVGYLVSQGFVWAGKGDSATWGVVAAVIATLSILLGKTLAVIIVVAEYYGITIFEMMQVLDYGQLMGFMVDTFELFDLVFYAIALQTAYKRSFIQPSKNYADYMKLKFDSTQTSRATDNLRTATDEKYETRSEFETEKRYESVENSAFKDTAYEDTGERAKRPVATPESEAR
jgi:hypothetical protein